MLKDYKRFCKEAVKNNINCFSWKKLIKNGLYMNPNSGLNKLNNLCDVHRLPACLKENITGLEVHHLDDNGLNNNIINLCPQDPIKHRRITAENRRRKKLA
ncbi:MAG: hypothetical protein NC408_07405 [Candidatus Gastranaerophilales bacterium]|nr:hypothetical protein [Candidatus Gastranaerophilales bacterium]